MQNNEQIKSPFFKKVIDKGNNETYVSRILKNESMIYLRELLQ